jgi:hypothetical protein
MVLVGGELLDVLLGQQRGVLSAAGSVDFEEDTQLQAGPPHVVERASAAWTAR